MPNITNVTVTLQGAPAGAAGAPAVNWQPMSQATYSTANPNQIHVTFAPANQPPAGFLNNPASTFVITGQDMASGAHFASPVVTADGPNSDPTNGVIAFL